MREISRVLATIALVFAVAVSADVLSAQENPAHDHIGHVTTAFPQTPGGEDLLPTAMAEVEVAIQHAGLAARDLGDFDAMKRHMSHVLHAVAAPEGSSGPARGFGAKRAAEGIAQHLELAAASDGASAAVQVQAAFGRHRSAGRSPGAGTSDLGRASHDRSGRNRRRANLAGWRGRSRPGSAACWLYHGGRGSLG